MSQKSYEVRHLHHSHWKTVIPQSQVEELVKMGCDGNKHILVERELLLNVDKQRVDLVGVCVVYGRSDGHRGRARGSEYVRTKIWTGMLAG